MLFRVTTRVVSLPHPDLLLLQEAITDMLTELVLTLLVSQDQLVLSPRAHSLMELLPQVGSQGHLVTLLRSERSRELVSNLELLELPESESTTDTELVSPLLDSPSQPARSPREAQSQPEPLRLDKTRSRELESNLELLDQLDTVVVLTEQVWQEVLSQPTLSPLDLLNQVDSVDVSACPTKPDRMACLGFGNTEHGVNLLTLI